MSFCSYQEISSLIQAQNCLWSFVQAVLNDHKVVCCDLCESWVHVSCDQLLSDDLYEAMVQEDSNEPWICAVCSNFVPAVVSVDHPKLNQLSCVCLNARSVLPK